MLREVHLYAMMLIRKYATIETEGDEEISVGNCTLIPPYIQHLEVLSNAKALAVYPATDARDFRTSWRCKMPRIDSKAVALH